ncbi:hypothetical protein RM717_26680 [Streptomyces griseus]|uniref:Uncharacterized protein n=1 Tax=Streptomyces stephensoniae TaxID=3375367 RepID=A0ABU2WAH2_9ACTN|nr:hypothetical protein [Streptomyces griseus]MDT0494097.1 hypothetical protein [Streptomyces griseus]
MPFLKIDTSSAVVFVATPPTPKLMSKQTGEIVVGREAGARLSAVGLLPTNQGVGSLHQVTMPITGTPESLCHPLHDCPRCVNQRQSAVGSLRAVS